MLPFILSAGFITVLHHQSNQLPVSHKHLRIPEHDRPNLVRSHGLPISSTMQAPQINLLRECLGSHSTALRREQPHYGFFNFHVLFGVYAANLLCKSANFCHSPLFFLPNFFPAYATCSCSHFLNCFPSIMETSCDSPRT